MDEERLFDLIGRLIMETPRMRIETKNIAVKDYDIIKPLISMQLIQVVHYQRYATILNRELAGS